MGAIKLLARSDYISTRPGHYRLVNRSAVDMVEKSQTKANAKPLLQYIFSDMHLWGDTWKRTSQCGQVITSWSIDQQQPLRKQWRKTSQTSTLRRHMKRTSQLGITMRMREMQNDADNAQIRAYMPMRIGEFAACPSLISTRPGHDRLVNRSAAILGDTVEKSQKNATSVTIHPLRQVFWGDTWKHTSQGGRVITGWSIDQQQPRHSCKPRHSIKVKIDEV